MSPQELTQRNIELRKSCEKEFQITFKQSLHQFFHPLFGFDVVAFDEWLQTPDGMSTADCVIQKYGQNAADLCYWLIG